MTAMKRNPDSIQPHELWEVKDYSEIMDINLKSRNRDRQTVWARYAVWLYLMEECGAKLIDISRLFGWHHASIIYGVNQIKEKLQINDGLAREQAMRIYRADPHERRPIQKGRAHAWHKAQIIHTIEVIPPEITPEARAAIEGGRPFHIELQELAETEREKKEKRKTTLKAIVNKYENNS